MIPLSFIRYGQGNVRSFSPSFTPSLLNKNMKHVENSFSPFLSSSSSSSSRTFFSSLLSSISSFSSSFSSFSSSSSFPPPLVTPEWLHNNIHKVKVVDGSWYMPAEKRNTLSEYEESHLPGAVHINQDEWSDQGTSLPHMLAPHSHFSHYVSSRGISDNDHIIVYDTHGVFASPRGWFTFKYFGGKKVSVLDGGLPAWKARGFPIEKGKMKINLNNNNTDGSSGNHSSNVYNVNNNHHKVDLSAVSPSSPSPSVSPSSSSSPSSLIWNGRPSWSKHVTYMHEMRENGNKYTVCVVDARSAKRFNGEVPDPREGVRSGHMPNSINIPFNDMLMNDEKYPGVQIMKPKDKIIEVFRAAGINPLSPHWRNESSVVPPIVFSCGTGVTACILGLAFEVVGGTRWKVYDGSWTEWGSHANNPVLTGPSTTKPISH